jgi:hypothetical protein
MESRVGLAVSLGMIALGVCGCQRDASDELARHLTNNTVVWEASSVIRTNYISSANSEGTTVGLLGLKEYSQGAKPIGSGFAVVIEDDFFNSLVANSFRRLHREPRLSGEWVYSGRSRSLVVFERQGEILARRRYSGFKQLWISVSGEQPPSSDSQGVPGE